MPISVEETAAWADAVWREGIRPPPSLSVAEWAELHRVLPQTSARPGPWRTWRVPYLEEPMAALSEDSGIERVVMVAGSQVGKTEVGLNWLGYMMDHAPGIALLVMPADRDTKRNVRTRIDPMIECAPRLRQRVGLARSRDGSNSVQRKVFPGGELIMTGSNSASSLRSTPVRYLFLDEVDAYPLSVEDEGDVVDLAMRRTATFRSQRKILLCSTPKLRQSSRIELAYRQSDQRRFFVPCLQCRHMAPITWDRIQWPKGERHKAHLVCDECGGITEEREKLAALSQGEWRPTAEGDGRTAGFHLPGLCSPFESWAEQAKLHAEAGSDPARLRVFVNTVLAESWDDTGGEEIEGSQLEARRGLGSEVVPAFAVLLTGSVDVQGDRLEAKVVAWGVGEEAAVVALERFPGDPSGPQVWRNLDDWLQRKWRSERGIDMELRAVCVDTGGHHTRAAYDFCRTRHHRRIWAIKGSSQLGAPAWPRKPPKPTLGLPLYMVGTNALKDTIAARLRVVENGPGKVHFTGALPPDYFDQLSAEHRLTKYTHGRSYTVWEKKPGVSRNEALDLFVYCLAALTGLQGLGVDLASEAEALDREAIGAAEPARRKWSSKWMDR